MDELQMLTFVLVNFLLLHWTWASYDVPLPNGWIPIAKPNVYYQVRRSYIENKYHSTWEPSENVDNNNIDIIKADAIKIVTPEQAESILYKKNVSATVPVVDVTEVPSFKNFIRERDLTYSNQGDDQIVTTSQLLDELSEQKFTTKRPQRVSKYLQSRSSINDTISTPITKNEFKIEPSETKISISVKNITGNNYEVTEATSKQDVLVIQRPNDENGYIYQQPTALSPGLNVSRNEYTKKLVQLLSIYNIKVHDMLNNYAQSKLHHNTILNVHPHHVPLVPFRYNSLNHRPVDPLLAVLLSNYGYYLQGFYGLPNNYRNLYGYSASNNIHNNKPFGSYKIFSDTDSSN